MVNLGHSSTSSSRDDEETPDATTTAEASNTKQVEKRTHYLQSESANEIPAFMSVAHLIGALYQTTEAIFLFAFSNNINVKWMIYTHFPVSVETSLSDEIGGLGTDNVYFARPESTYLSSVNATWVTGVIVLLSAIDHLFCVFQRTRSLYEFCLSQSKAPYRWIEYAISCSLMNFHIAQLVGMTDAHLLFMVVALSVCIQFPAYLFEVVNARARAENYPMVWSPFVCACIPYTAVWGVILSYYLNFDPSGDGPPMFVFTTVVSVFTLESLFPILFILQWLKIGIFKEYIVGEYGYMILGVVAKSALAWLTVVGSKLHGSRT